MCESVSVTVIVVPWPDAVVVVLLTVNVPEPVVGDTVATVVSLLTAVKFPEYPFSLAVKVFDPAPLLA